MNDFVRETPLRIVIAEDSGLLRAGIARLLIDSGHQVVAEAQDGPSFLLAIEEHHPDVVVVDVRMPPGFKDEGLKAALTPAAGNLANDLRDLYAYMSMRLTYANLHSDIAAVEECQRLMQPIREAWASIAPAQNEQRVAA